MASTASKFAEDAEVKAVTDKEGIPDGWLGLDIGEGSTKTFAEVITDAKTIVWNGPMGVSEWENFGAFMLMCCLPPSARALNGFFLNAEKGTKGVMDAVVEATKRSAVTIIGGGKCDGGDVSWGFNS